MLEASLFIIKPDMDRRLHNEIFNTVRNHDLTVLPEELFVVSKDFVAKFYEASIKKWYNRGVTDLQQKIEDLYRFGPIGPALVIGEDAVYRLRTLCGTEADPALCAEGTLRRKYCAPDAFAWAKKYNLAVHNSFHSSEHKEDAKSEIQQVIKNYQEKLAPHGIVL